MTSLLGPDDTRLRRVRTILAFVLAVLLVVAVVAAALGEVLLVVWTLVLGAVFVVGHLWSWPRDGRLPVPTADLASSPRGAVATGIAVGVASSFAVVLQGGTAGQGLTQAAITTVVAVPLFLLLAWWQRRRTT